MRGHILIGGGTGFIGKYLSNFLQPSGYLITIISRMPGPGHISWLELEKLGIPNDVTAVVNLAGQNVLDPTRRWTEGYRKNVWYSRIISTGLLANAISKAPAVESFVNIVGVSHYKPHPDKIYSEDDKVEAYDYMSKLCIEWEKASALPPEVAKRCRNVILRTGVVIGRDGGMIKSMDIPFKLGLGGVLGTGKQTLPWIHINDLCGLIQWGIENSTSDSIINAVAPELCTNEEFSKAYAKALHRPCVFKIPELFLRAVFGSERCTLLLSGARISSSNAKNIGFHFKYPTAADACRDVI